MLCACVYQYADLSFECCPSIYSDRYVGWAPAREVLMNGLSSNSVCIANGLIYKAYTLQRYSDKQEGSCALGRSPEND